VLQLALSLGTAGVMLLAQVATALSCVPGIATAAGADEPAAVSAPADGCCAERRAASQPPEPCDLQCCLGERDAGLTVVAPNPMPAAISPARPAPAPLWHAVVAKRTFEPAWRVLTVPSPPRFLLICSLLR